GGGGLLETHESAGRTINPEIRRPRTETAHASGGPGGFAPGDAGAEPAAGDSAASAGSARSPYSLFEVYGVEIEYAVVRRDTMAVDPSADRLLSALGGDPDAHPSSGNVEADNELAAHVLEIKCKAPTRDLALQAGDFAAFVKLANRTLSQWNCRLMPGGMHPFMDPARESRIWPHEDKGIYEAYDRIFGVRGHGWFNIQS